MEGVPLDTESEHWKAKKERGRIIEENTQKNKEAKLIAKGLVAQCCNCVRMGDLLLDGIWWCGRCWKNAH